MSEFNVAILWWKKHPDSHAIHIACLVVEIPDFTNEQLSWGNLGSRQHSQFSNNLDNSSWLE